MPVISIIVTTKNEEEVIENLLLSIQKQTYKYIEIIIVDNNSRDKTIEISKKYTKNIYNKGPERSAQRNFGAHKSKGEILVFLDADMQLHKDVVTSCVNILQNDHMVGVVIPEKSIGTGFWATCKILEREYYLNVDWIESARCFTRKAFYSVGGYDETLSGPEDFDLPQRVKYKFGVDHIGRIKEFITHNEGHLNFFELMKRKYYYGLSMSKYVSKRQHTQYAVKQGNVIKRYALFFQKPGKILSRPFVFLGMLMLKTSELTAIAFGTLVGLKGVK